MVVQLAGMLAALMAGARVGSWAALSVLTVVWWVESWVVLLVAQMARSRAVLLVA